MTGEKFIFHPINLNLRHVKWGTQLSYGNVFR